jgi:hypothetical protein
MAIVNFVVGVRNVAVDTRDQREPVRCRLTLVYGQRM